MKKIYFKIAWRNLLKDRQFTILNLVGLSTGLACVLLIFLWVSDELQIDRFHANDSRLYQVMVTQRMTDGTRTIDGTNALLARTLKVEMPEVEYAAGSLGKSWYGAITLSAGSDSLRQNSVKASGHFADKDFFNVFSYGLLDGNKDQVLSDKRSIVLSRDLAMRLFHTTENVVGRTIQWQHDSTMTVSGIFGGIPSQSSDQFDFVVPMDKFLDQNAYEKNWGNSSDPATYIVLKQDADIDAFNHKIAGFMKTKNPTDTTETLFARQYGSGYLYGKYENGKQSGGRIEYVRLFSAIAIFILLIACINFMNLSTAKASRRMKEVGIKKVVGASRGELILQYLGESLLLSTMALLITLILVVGLLPAFNALTGKQLSLHFDTSLVAAILAITVFTGLLAGSYPALYLSGFKPVAVLKGRLKNSIGELWIRKGLVVFQFTLTVVFIVAIMVVYKQVQYIQTKNLGFNKDNLLSFDMAGSSPQNTTAFLSEMRNIPGIVNASGLDHIDLYDNGGSVPRIEGKPQTDIEIHNIGVNYGMIETLEMELSEGRSFSKSLSSDSAEVILNQAAVDAFGLADPIGKHIELFWGDGKRKIVGVVKNFHFQSLHENVKPFAIRLVTNYTRGMLAKIEAGKEKQTLDQLQVLYARFHPGSPFEYRFLDDAFQAQYTAEKRVAVLSRWFGGLAILISCLGLFGLATFTAEKRFKEIGIRKVLGARVSGVVAMLTADFLKLVAVAIFIAFPLAWWGTNQWLNGFAYHIHMGPGLFLIAGVLTLLITVLTIGFQAVKAAASNPIKALRSE